MSSTKYPFLNGSFGGTFHQDYILLTDFPESKLAIEVITGHVRRILDDFINDTSNISSIKNEIIQILDVCKTEEELTDTLGIDGIKLDQVINLRALLTDILSVLEKEAQS